MSTVIIISCNYTLSVEVKKFRNVLCSKKSKTSTKDKHFGNKEQYSYFWLLKKFEKLIESMNWIRNTGSWKAIPYLILQKMPRWWHVV